MVVRGHQDLDANIIRWGLHHLLDGDACVHRPQSPTTDYAPPPPQPHHASALVDAPALAEVRVDAVDNDEVIAHALQEELAQVAMAEASEAAGGEPDRRAIVLEVYNEVLARLRSAGGTEISPAFEDALWAHFHRLPARYALDVNVEREEDVVTHQRLLEEARDPQRRSALSVRVVQASEQEYEKEKLNERIAKLSGGVAVIQVGAQTGIELKEKKLRVEDALNATKEGIVVGGGCTLLRLASKVNAIKETLENDEQKVGAEIVRKSLSYQLKLIAKNAGVNGSMVTGVNGSMVTEKVLVNDNFRYAYNAATGKYEDLMAAGIIDPTKVVRCCLEHAASVAKTFITSDAVVVDIKESEQAPAANPMAGSGYGF